MVPTIYSELADLLNLDPADGSDMSRLWKDPLLDRDLNTIHTDALSAASTPTAHTHAPQHKLERTDLPPQFFQRKPVQLPRHGKTTNLFPTGSGIQAVDITNKRITKVVTDEMHFTPRAQRPGKATNLFPAGSISNKRSATDTPTDVGFIPQAQRHIVSLHELRHDTANKYTAWTDPSAEEPHNMCQGTTELDQIALLDISMGSDSALNDSMDTEQAHEELDWFF